MEITGKLIQILPEETGEGRNGPWKKQNFIIETQEQYPKKVCIVVWGDKINLSEYKEGEMVTVSINIESREWNGKWFTDVKAWRMAKTEPASGQLPGGDAIPPEKEPPPYIPDEPEDDLPF